MVISFFMSKFKEICKEIAEPEKIKGFSVLLK